ncbi:MAG: 16S rRNA (uracil(1498)-N(3))-methyltransferase [Symploca sp. SIO3E6]|nr:16S rRNA (uracil(1498)-N(3))-methyltransferase [Caldora sp. SIO3E6]
MAHLQRLVITPTQRQDSHISLTDAQQHYLVRVLRLGSGDCFIAMDGQGSWWLCELAASLSQAKIIESISVETELPLEVTLMVAMPKGSGFEQVVSQATELGVTTIMPVKSDRTLLNPSNRKLERWRRLTQEAAEQSERQVVPTVLEPVDFTTAIQLTDTPNTHRYICVARGDAPHLLNCLLDKELLWETVQPHNYQPLSIVVATGPEGGWTVAEVEQATAAGFKLVSLGNRILRAVTAPIVAISLVAALNNK